MEPATPSKQPTTPIAAPQSLHRGLRRHLSTSNQYTDWLFMLANIQKARYEIEELYTRQLRRIEGLGPRLSEEGVTDLQRTAEQWRKTRQVYFNEEEEIIYQYRRDSDNNKRW